MIRIAQVSDTHLSRSHAYFHDNWRILVDELGDDGLGGDARSTPDLIVHSGDVAFNGPVAEDDLAFARAEMERLPARWRIVPGNHDIGEAPAFSRLDQPLTDARVAAWRRHFGPNWWHDDIGEWRFVGIDTSLLGSAREEEHAQTMFLRDVLDGGRPVLLFMHMPPFVMSPDDPASSSCVPPEPRRALLELCRTSGVRAIACGHLHIYRHMCWSDIDIVWAPGTSFVTTERWHQRLGTFPRAGYVAWTIDGQTLSHRVIEPPRMITMDLGLWSDTHGTTTKLPPLHGRVGT